MAQGKAEQNVTITFTPSSPPTSSNSGSKGSIMGIIRNSGSNEHQQIITPFRYNIVEEGVFRGAYPSPRNFRFLKRLKLKTMISLIPQTPNNELIKFCQTQKIVNKHISIGKFKEEDAKITLDPQTVAQILQEIINTKNHPVYIHCLDGAHNTGLIVMALRKLQNWSLSIIFSEFSRFVRDGIIHSTESEFIENFRAQVLIPLSTPKWLWQGERIQKHPTVRIKLVAEDQNDLSAKENQRHSRVQALLNHTETSIEHAIASETLSKDLQALALDGTF